jgi:hypothetical protein
MAVAFLALLELTFRIPYRGPAVFQEFQGCPGIDTLVAGISFLETRRNHWGPSQANNEGGGLQLIFNSAELLH